MQYDRLVEDQRVSQDAAVTRTVPLGVTTEGSSVDTTEAKPPTVSVASAMHHCPAIHAAHCLDVHQ